MRKDDVLGKKLFYREEELGEIIDLKKDAFDGHEQIIVVEITKNDLKVVPAKMVHHVSGKYEFKSDRNIFDNSPVLSAREIENEPKKIKDALKDHYGEPESWGERKIAKGEKHDQDYMGANQPHNQAPENNKTLKGKMDYDKIKGIDSDK